MKSTLTMLLVALFAAASATAAAPANEAQAQLAAFHNLQVMCKASLLMRPSAIPDFVRATRSTLEATCECTALLTLAAMPPEQVTAIGEGSAATLAKASPNLDKNFVSCVNINYAAG